MLDKFSDAQRLHLKDGYRVYNTHLRYDMLPTGAKYIYTVRDGRDVVTSFYHHLSNQHIDDGGFVGEGFEEFLDLFLRGQIPYGKWSHHLCAWMEAIDEGGGNILLVQYEDLKRNLEHEIDRIASFLGIEDYNVETVLQRASFDYMKHHQSLFHPVSVRWKEGYNFIRSGVVGDHTTLFTDEQNDRFIKTIRRDFQEVYGIKNSDERCDQMMIVVPSRFDQLRFANDYCYRKVDQR
jgi:hypothetical protein